MMATNRGLAALNRLLRPSAPTSPFLAAPILRPYPRLPRTLQPAQVARRYAHQIPKPGRPSPPGGQDNATPNEAKPRKLLEPHYELTFTCVPCTTRSTHTISKQGYHKGSVLITCPSCRNRHIISDHLNIFGDRKLTIEDLMREKGQLVKRGTLGVDGDIEFWEDGTQTARAQGFNAADRTETKPELESPSAADDASSRHDARNPAAPEFTAASTTAASTTSPLHGSGSRPQIHDTSATKTTPSTKREIHTQNTSKTKVPSDPFKIDDDLLLELRSNLRGHTQNSTKYFSPTSYESSRKAKDSLEGPVRRTNPPIRKHLVGRANGFQNGPPASLAARPLPISKIPAKDVELLQHAVQTSTNTMIKPIGIPSTMRSNTGSLEQGRELDNIAAEHFEDSSNTLYQKEHVSKSSGLPSTLNSSMNKTHGHSSSPSPFRFVKVKHKFGRREHDDVSSTAEAAEHDIRSEDEELRTRMYRARMHRMVHKKARVQRTRTVYAWPEGTTEPVEVQVAVLKKRSPLTESDQPLASPIADAAASKPPPQLPFGVPIRPPLVHKFKPKKEKKAWDENAPIDPDDFAAEMRSGARKKTPQGPVPGELYEQFLKNVESAKNLEKQKVTLDDFDIYDLGMRNHRI